MRDYAKIVPTFWTGATGKILRKSPEGALVGLYLLSSPHSNMLGLYYQPLLYMAHETGLGIEGASKGLQDCIDAGFCRYDQATEMVWVIEMAAYQVGEALKPADKRCAGIQKDYEALPDNPFLGAFYDKYQAAFHLKKRRGEPASKDGNSGGSEQGPSKAHRSQEQEQEQEQDLGTEQFRLEGASSDADQPARFKLTLNDLSEHHIAAIDIDRWQLAFPGVDVCAQLLRMEAWLTANPRKRKTATGVEKFIVTWLAKEQDKPRPNGRAGHRDDTDEWGIAL